MLAPDSTVPGADGRRRGRSRSPGVAGAVGVPGRGHARRREVRGARVPAKGAGMSYTLRGRLESRLAAAAAAARSRPARSRVGAAGWWPLELAALMAASASRSTCSSTTGCSTTSPAGWRCRSALLELGLIDGRRRARSGSARRSSPRSRSSPRAWLARAGARPRGLPARCGCPTARTAASSAAPASRSRPSRSSRSLARAGGRRLGDAAADAFTSRPACTRARS